MSWPTLGDAEREPLTEEAAMRWHEDAMKQLVALFENHRALTEHQQDIAAWYFRELIERAAARRELLIERRPRGRPEGRGRQMALHLVVLTALHGEREARRAVKEVWSVSSLQVSEFMGWARAEIRHRITRCLRHPTTHLDENGAVVLRTWTDERDVLTAMDDYLRGIAERRE